MLHLTLHTQPPLPLELEGILPEHLANLSPEEVARKPVRCGNRREELGNFFAVAGNLEDRELVLRGDCSRVKQIGAEMTAGRVVVEGDVGFHAGAGMKGGELCVRGNAGDWLGAEMSGGVIHVFGNTGHCTGAALRGSRFGMTGGAVLVHGNAGDETGVLMRRGLIAVSGRCGTFAGASMIAGTLIVLGEAGRAAGAGMKRGTLVVGRCEELGPGFQSSCEYRPTYMGLLTAQLQRLRFDPANHVDLRNVRCIRGDRVNSGNGEVLMLG